MRWRHARIVIGETESQRAHTVPREETTEADVPTRVRVPLRKDEHGGTAIATVSTVPTVSTGTRWKITAPHGVVFPMRRGERAGKSERVALELVV